MAGHRRGWRRSRGGSPIGLAALRVGPARRARVRRVRATLRWVSVGADQSPAPLAWIHEQPASAASPAPAGPRPRSAASVRRSAPDAANGSGDPAAAATADEAGQLAALDDVGARWASSPSPSCSPSLWPNESGEKLSYTEFMTQVDDGNVESVVINNSSNTITGTLTDGAEFTTTGGGDRGVSRGRRAGPQGPGRRLRVQDAGQQLAAQHRRAAAAGRC